MTAIENWTLVHREMLEHLVYSRIYTWAGEPLRRGVEEGRARFDLEHRRAFVDLQHAGFVCGEHLTEAGRKAARAAGLNPDERLEGHPRP